VFVKYLQCSVYKVSCSFQLLLYIHLIHLVLVLEDSIWWFYSLVKKFLALNMHCFIEIFTMLLPMNKFYIRSIISMLSLLS